MSKSPRLLIIAIILSNLRFVVSAPCLGNINKACLVSTTSQPRDAILEQPNVLALQEVVHVKREAQPVFNKLATTNAHEKAPNPAQDVASAENPTHLGTTTEGGTTMKDGPTSEGGTTTKEGTTIKKGTKKKSKAHKYMRKSPFIEAQLNHPYKYMDHTTAKPGQKWPSVDAFDIYRDNKFPPRGVRPAEDMVKNWEGSIISTVDRYSVPGWYRDGIMIEKLEFVPPPGITLKGTHLKEIFILHNKEEGYKGTTEEVIGLTNNMQFGLYGEELSREVRMELGLPLRDKPDSGTKD